MGRLTTLRSVSAAEADSNGANNSDNSGNGGAAAPLQIPAMSDWVLLLFGLALGISGWWALKLEN